jgi:sugar lactone lactonase YvrE
MNDLNREATGGLFNLDGRLHCTQVEGGVAVPNSLAWSPDEKTMYFADTENRLIHAYDFDAQTGRRRPARVFADLRDGPGQPDGATVDAHGCLWGAEVGSGRVVRYAPDGRELMVVQLPVTRVTSLTFGGADLRTLFITTARQKLDDDELRQQPHAGALFAMQGTGRRAARCYVRGLDEDDAHAGGPSCAGNTPLPQP